MSRSAAAGPDTSQVHPSGSRPTDTVEKTGFYAPVLSSKGATQFREHVSEMKIRTRWLTLPSVKQATCEQHAKQTEGHHEHESGLTVGVSPHLTLPHSLARMIRGGTVEHRLSSPPPAPRGPAVAFGAASVVLFASAVTTVARRLLVMRGLYA